MTADELRSVEDEPTCAVCGHRASWGCGHTLSQRRDALCHEATAKHINGECWHYSHRDCTPDMCRTPRLVTPGYVAFVEHREIAEGFDVLL